MKNLIYFFFYYFAKFVDILFSPIALTIHKLGYSYLEVRNKSFGHHIWEPLALYYFNERSKFPKKLIFLSDPRRARIQTANVLLTKLGTVVDSYNFFSPIYWLARSPYCGFKRDFTCERDLQVFYDIHSQFVSQTPPFETVFSSDPEILRLVDFFSLQGSKILYWKPKVSIPNTQQNRSSGLSEAVPLIQRLQQDGYRVVTYCEGQLPSQISNLTNVADIKEKSSREKLSLWLDLNCSMGLCGQTGGSILMQLMNKPLIVYDIAYPFHFYYFSQNVLLCFKSAFYSSTDCPVPFTLLPKLKNFNQLDNHKVYFNNCLSDELLATYDEMLSKLRLYKSSGFPPNSYVFNQQEFSFTSDSAFYNNYGYPQISDASLKKLIDNNMI